jgi:tubulin-specific chaperone C
MDLLQTFNPTGGERTDAYEHCQASIARLSDSVKDASSLIPAHDQKTYGEALKALTTKLQNLKASFAPKPKFSFRTGLRGQQSMFTAKKNASAISLRDAAEMAERKRRQVPGFVDSNSGQVSGESSGVATPAEMETAVRASAAEEMALGGGEEGPLTAVTSAHDGSNIPSSNPTTSLNVGPAGDGTRTIPTISHGSQSVKITDQKGAHIILPPSAAHATSSGTLANLSKCVVDLSSPTLDGNAVSGGVQPFASLTLKNISSSLILCGRVNGPIHLTHITDSVIVLSSRQFRMHESRNTQVYLQTSSRPIIEDCSDIAFAPLPERYSPSSEGQGQWNQVDDFKWLRSDAPSPNWRVLQPVERVRESVWMGTVTGGPGVGVEEILRSVGVGGEGSRGCHGGKSGLALGNL